MTRLALLLAACFVAPYLGAPGYDANQREAGPRSDRTPLALVMRDRGGGNQSKLTGLRTLTHPATPLARRISGTATWYCSATSACTRGYRPSDMVAAIDSDLGFHKGQRVRVTYFGRSVVVRIVDVCGCAGDRLIDLTSGSFARLAPLDLGVIPVMLELAGDDPRPVPLAPQTDGG